ncbi:MAG: glycosyltransferase [Verrucomicrobiae bacterium]|nr:glycosyltransferase [Verrucomicrobiae bacterium]
MTLAVWIFAGLAGVSLGLLLWQWIAAWRFPLHQRIARPGFAPAVTLFKPLKGCDAETRACLESWLTQDYGGPVQVLFGVASELDPVVAVVRELLAAHPRSDAQLMICPESRGANAKVSTLLQLAPAARHELWIISDADVRVPRDFLANVVAPFHMRETGLVTCFYALANPTTLAMRCEAVAVNGDFWSQVLQANSLRPMQFALGAVMAVRRRALQEAGGFEALKDLLADDYHLGRRVAGRGWRIELCPVVVGCWEAPQGWAQVFRHQLRWARTIRACQPVPYFFSLLSNGTLWPALMMLAGWSLPWTGAGCLLIAVRAAASLWLQHRLTRQRGHLFYDFLVVVKDFMQAAVWLLAFTGNTIEWRGQKARVTRDGQLIAP